MSILIDWDNEEQTILRHTYSGGWTLDDFYWMLDSTYDIINGVEHSVDIIADFLSSAPPPRNIISALPYYQQKRHPRQGLQVVVGTSFLLIFTKAVTQAASIAIPQARQVRFTSILEEARALLRQARQSSANNGDT